MVLIVLFFQHRYMVLRFGLMLSLDHHQCHSVFVTRLHLLTIILRWIVKQEETLRCSCPLHLMSCQHIGNRCSIYFQFPIPICWPSFIVQRSVHLNIWSILILSFLKDKCIGWEIWKSCIIFFYIILVSWFNNCILQTLIYFFDPKDLKQDQLIEGRVTLSQNQASSRLLDVKIAYEWVSLPIMHF